MPRQCSARRTGFFQQVMTVYLTAAECKAIASPVRFAFVVVLGHEPFTGDSESDCAKCGGSTTRVVQEQSRR